MTTQTANQVRPLFALGQTFATPGALLLMQGLKISPITLLTRHQQGDWSDMDATDQQSNTEAIRTKSRIFSAYKVSPVVKLLVITEADRSATTILLPEEY